MFEIDRVYRRQDLHSKYLGQEQGGISTPRDHPLIFLFTGSAGERHGYTDAWEEDGKVFRYYGEGQQGDMQFVRGNSAIRDHAESGKDLHLFRADHQGHATYLGQFVCAGYVLEPKVPDTAGTPRTAIVFRLVPIAGADPAALPGSEAVPPKEGDVPTGWYWSAPLEQVLAAAIVPPAPNTSPTEARRIVRKRSEAVKVFVQRRAQGKCEGCGDAAPFKTAEGRPYLEPHHTRRLSDGGPDHPAWVVAVCPTCHRRAHHAVDAKAFNTGLVKVANSLTPP
jgi:5-methylcytosine-specific restriction protein A